MIRSNQPHYRKRRLEKALERLKKQTQTEQSKVEITNIENKLKNLV